MARLQHLLDGATDAPVYQLDFGAEVTKTTAKVVAQAAVDRIAPIIRDLVTQMQANEQQLKAGVDGVTEVSERAVADIEAKLDAELSNLQKDVRRAFTVMTKTQASDARSLRESLVKALSKVKIHDYSEDLNQLKVMQQAVMSALKDVEKEDDDPKEWEFTVNRNRNGFIQSVTAKAK